MNLFIDRFLYIVVVFVIWFYLKVYSVLSLKKYIELVKMNKLYLWGFVLYFLSGLMDVFRVLFVKIFIGFKCV